MKNLRQVLTSLSGCILLTALVTGCANPEYGSSDIDLTANEEARNQVFQQILDNQELFDEFMNEMMQHEQSMQRMMNHDQMTQHMYNSENMHSMMQQNPEMRDHMMQEWMNLMNQDTSYYNQMNHMMDEGHMGMGDMN